MNNRKPQRKTQRTLRRFITNIYQEGGRKKLREITTQNRTQFTLRNVLLYNTI
jgi:hypothetical protein